MAKKIINVVYDVNDKELDTAKKKIQEVEKETKKSETAFQKMGKTGTEAFGLIGGIAATLGLAALGKQIFDITAEFQKLAAVLTNTLGSRSLALSALNDIKLFASQTPFSVQELTASFVKLANQGFRPTIVELRKLGDIASSQGKQFDQLTEALIDAQTGEFERLKEFGIRAAKEGDNVTFTFKGVQTQVEFTNEAIRGYILTLGEAEGVTGSMAAISETLGGQVSNMGDSFDSLFNGLGQASTGILSYVLTQLSTAVQFVAEIVNSANQLRDPFAGERAKAVGEAFEAFQKLTRPQQAKEINDMAQEVQYWRKELELLEKAFKVNEETGLTAQEKLEKASKILGLSVEDTFDIFKNYNFELELTKSNVKETEEIFKLFLATYNKVNTGTTKVVEGTKKLNKELSAFKLLTVSGKTDPLNVSGQINNLDKLNSSLESHVSKFKDSEKVKTEISKEEENKRLELRQMVSQLTEELIISSLNLALTSREVDTQAIQDKYDRELELAGDNDRAKEQIEAERDRKLRAAEIKNKQIQKDNARSKILIDTAVAVIKTFAEFGYPPGIVPAALMTGISLIQLANVRKYKDGEVAIDGPGTTTSDSINAKLSRGESVINAAATAKSRNLLEAINDRKIDDRILQVAANGGSQVNVFDDSRIIAELQKGRVDYEVQGYTLMRSERRGANFKLLMRAKNQGY